MAILGSISVRLSVSSNLTVHSLLCSVHVYLSSPQQNINFQFLSLFDMILGMFTACLILKRRLIWQFPLWAVIHQLLGVF